MGNEHHTIDYIRGDKIHLYTSQALPVLQAIEKDGCCISKAAYVENKYQESARSFLAAYQWLSREGAKIAKKPKRAELPYWAFADLYQVEQSGSDSKVLELLVPKDQLILFDLYDWMRIMRFEYLGESPGETAAFKEELRQCGLREYDVMMSRFYPEWREKIMASWKRLFRHHEALLAGERGEVQSIQAALWTIRKEWIIEG